jgi:hypothetical protein
MKSTISKFLIIFALITTASCTDDFEEINTNPLSLSTG